MAASAATTRLLPASAACTPRVARCRPFLQVCRAGRQGRGRHSLIQLDDLDSNELSGLGPAGGLPPLPSTLAPLPEVPPATQVPQRQRYQNAGQRGYGNQRGDYGGYGNFNPNYTGGSFNSRRGYYDRNARPYNDLGTQGELVDADGYYTEDPEVDEDGEPEPLYVGGKRLWVNQEINSSQVRLQTETGESMGIVPLRQAMEMAAEESVDVVCLNDELSPPLCRLVAASKYKFEWERAQKASKKKQRETQVEVKEVRLRPITDTADLQTKTRNAEKFLQKGAKVKITMSFTGREQRFKEQGRELLLKLIEDLAALATLEGPVSVRGSTFSAMLAPLKK